MSLLCTLAPALLLVARLQTSTEAPQNPAEAGARWVETFSAALPGGSGGVEVDDRGFVYCADFGSRLGPGGTGGDKVYRLDPETGKAQVFVGGLRGASGNAMGADGSFYQSNIGTGSITRVSPEGEPTPYAKGLRSPVGIAIDEDGVLFVAGCGSNSIVAVTRGGATHEYASDPLLSCPNGLAFDEDANLYVCNFNNGDVIKIDWTGEVSRFATLPGKNNGHLVYHEGALYVVARGAHQVFRVALDGKVELFAGSGERGRRDGPALEASFSFPNDLAFSPDGRFLYVNENASLTEPGTVLAPMIVRRIRIEEGETR